MSQVETGKASGLELYGSVAEVLGLRLVALPRDQADDQTRVVS